MLLSVNAVFDLVFLDAEAAAQRARDANSDDDWED